MLEDLSCYNICILKSQSNGSVSIVYTMIGDVCLYIVSKDEYDELALSEVIFAVMSAVKDVCAKPPTERLFLDKYGRICPCLDEIIWQVPPDNTEKDKVQRLIRLKPPVEPCCLNASAASLLGCY
ncbi:TSET complex member tstD-like [Triticum aestivum]|uniref:TSET complex member tstD-like n=1 Tax=Triticum aestivum TaxID=4565 RepID=UPI001D02535F|nr:TSET complex member tstD-like [Triticum aestivum]